ncbi:hypothetical protein EP47_14255 [Legionella norrlandica]|uniref:Uncharacterized protein n=1 Tax=Legionella norrlandica TaxID=1498499 RepID=A0A0A2SNX0_9GAMM|nr:hypothetical protein [Legionella norrlandica]KGP62840.1 hypothetical protein EP47_14255 [Legionella norrlandica]
MRKFYALTICLILFSYRVISYADEQTCNDRYDYCMTPCNNQYDKCTRDNEAAYCKDQYQPCILECSNTRDNCLSQAVVKRQE